MTDQSRDPTLIQTPQRENTIAKGGYKRNYFPRPVSEQTRIRNPQPSPPAAWPNPSQDCLARPGTHSPSAPPGARSPLLPRQSHCTAPATAQIASLPGESRPAVEAVRQFQLHNLPTIVLSALAHFLQVGVGADAINATLCRKRFPFVQSISLRTQRWVFLEFRGGWFDTPVCTSSGLVWKPMPLMLPFGSTFVQSISLRDSKVGVFSVQRWLF